jgi:hypothetical protein
MKKREPVRYFSLHPRNAVFLLIVTSIVISVLVFAIGHGSLFVEIQITLSIIAFCLFGFMAIGLYHGVRVLKDSVDVPEVKAGRPWDWLSYFGIVSIPMPEVHYIDLRGVGDIGGGDDLAGCLISILIWAVITILIAVILAVVVPLIGNVIVVFFAALYWIFYQALRQVFARSRYCRGNWRRALGVSFIFTATYTGWLLALISARNLLPMLLK